MGIIQHGFNNFEVPGNKDQTNVGILSDAICRHIWRFNCDQMMSIPSYCHGERAERFLHDNLVADDQDHIGEHWETPAFFLAKI